MEGFYDAKRIVESRWRKDPEGKRSVAKRKRVTSLENTRPCMKKIFEQLVKGR